MKSRIVCLGMVLFLAEIVNVEAQYNYTTISVPGAEDTYVLGISGNEIVGYYNSNGGYDQGQGFLYDGSSYTTLSFPGAVNTVPCAIFGNNIVGGYLNSVGLWHGFIYNGSTYSTLDFPGAAETFAQGISANGIVGSINYNTGFLYNGSTWTTLSVPGAGITSAFGISGNEIVGNYQTSSAYYGFLYNGTSYTTLSVPGAENYTVATGISGNDIVGSYLNSSGFTNGFVYNGSSYITLGVPGATHTYGQGIDGNNIAGYYENSSGNIEGFLATPIPEPSILTLLAIGAGAFLVRRQSQDVRKGSFLCNKSTQEFLRDQKTLSDAARRAISRNLFAASSEITGGLRVVGIRPNSSTHAFFRTLGHLYAPNFEQTH